MAKIHELLDNLLHKKLGRDVRQSIHDAIQQRYDDATGNPESVAAAMAELDKTPYAEIVEGEAEDLPVYTINDSETGTASTWSSEKITNEIKTVVNDDETVKTSTWSSEKINEKIDEVFQNASNGKKTLATAIGNGATADMTWDELANKTLKVNLQHKETTSKDGVYFDKAFDNVILWVVVGTNSEYERTASVKEVGSYTDKWGGTLDVVTQANTDKVTYSFTDTNKTKLHAKMYQTSSDSTETWYDCYQIGYN